MICQLRKDFGLLFRMCSYFSHFQHARQPLLALSMVSPHEPKPMEFSSQIQSDFCFSCFNRPLQGGAQIVAHHLETLQPGKLIWSTYLFIRLFHEIKKISQMLMTRVYFAVQPSQL